MKNTQLIQKKADKEGKENTDQKGEIKNKYQDEGM